MQGARPAAERAPDLFRLVHVAGEERHAGPLADQGQGGGAGRASRALGERTMLIVGLGLLVAGFGGMAVAHSEAVLIVSLIVLVAGIGFATPALNALIAEQAEPQERGAVMGLSQSASALGRVLGPMCAGAIFDAFGHGAPFAAGAALMLAALFVATSERALHHAPSRG